MSDAGAPTPPGLPDRAARMGFYRRRLAARLRFLRRTAACFGAVVGLALALGLLLADDGLAVALIFGTGVGAATGALFSRKLLALFDRDQVLAPALVVLPPFQDLRFSWAGPGDLAEIDGALDEEVVQANHWSEQDRADVLLVPRLPGFAASTFTWVVRDRATGELVGATACEDDAVQPGIVSIGLWLAPGQRGLGRGAEVLERAVPLVQARLRSDPGGFAGDPDQLTLSTDADNAAMRRTAERAGGLELGSYPHLLPDGSEIEVVRYWFGSGQPPSATVAATAAAGSGRAAPPDSDLVLSRRLVITVAVLAVALLGAITVRSVTGARDHQDDLVAASVRAAEDVRVDLFLDEYGPLVVEPSPSTPAPRPGGTTTTRPLRQAEAELLRTPAGDGEFVVTWRPRSGGTVQLSALRVPEQDERELFTTDDRSDDGELHPFAIAVDGGSLVVAIVPAITETVLLEVDGADPIALPTIDLTDRGAPAGAARAVASVVPGDASGATLTAVDANGSRTTAVVRAT